MRAIFVIVGNELATEPADVRFVDRDHVIEAASVNILNFAATTPNLATCMEYVWRAPQKPESWYAPNFEIRNGVIPLPPGPGLGVEFDPDFVKKATVVRL